MAKKKHQQNEAPSGDIPETTRRNYKIASWKNKDLFQCSLCRFDSFERKEMLKHLVSKHNDELALVELVELEGNLTSSALQASPAHAAMPHAGEGEQGEVFEVELVETDTTVDAHGNEHKTFTVKE
jgi:hypothetical protein